LFYGLAHQHGGDGSVLTLFRYNADGKSGNQIALDKPLSSDPTPIFAPLQVAAVGKNLAIIRSSDAMRGGPAQPPTIYIVEPKTGKVVYSGEIRPTVAPEAAPQADALPRLWKSLCETDDDIVARPLAAKIAGSGDAAAAFLRANLPRLDPVDPAKVRELLARLDQDQWKEREEATAELLRSAGAVETHLRTALAATKSDEVRTRIAAMLQQVQSLREADPAADETDRLLRDPNLRARLRGIRILLRIATPATVDALREIASGEQGSIDTEQAKIALQKM
jgi:signal transduction histidine kinase